MEKSLEIIFFFELTGIVKDLLIEFFDLH
jgi:hypothetical protein